MAVSPVSSRCLIFDLEVVPAQDNKPGKIIKLGALRPDTGDELELNTGNNLDKALQQLEAMTTGVDFVLGHNVIEHDLPLLQEAAPWLKLLSLPVIDTLCLSPLAFPQNPYHRLIKDYKLIRDSLNSPLADCRSTWTLFEDQQKAFQRLYDTHPEEVLCYQSFLAFGSSYAAQWLQRTISSRESFSLEQLRECIPTLLKENDPMLERNLKVCRTRLRILLDSDLFRLERALPLAYTLSWLRVSGGNSVLAPWVKYQFPLVSQLIQELRDIPCHDVSCQYCRTTHNPRHELQRYFGFSDFRYEKEGHSLQRDIVQAGMRNQHVLAILPTSGGKSLCYQLPALNRFHRNGSLTIIVSPLQSLMKDQVDGLLERNVQCVGTLNGLLTMPERADVLEKIQLGDIGILLVSPEQFRNQTFRRAIGQREIGAWIFDEAHCLSKWGSDFRPDYLYAARFIREHTGSRVLAPIGCFTATAKPDVLEDIRQHFKEMLSIEFEEFLGNPERKNLTFDVIPSSRSEKWRHAHQLLSEELEQQEGGAVVFVSSRKNAEALSEFLKDQDWSCKYFHAGLRPNDKKDIQDSFKSGELRIIVATNAFGMGVDKADIRLVLHAEIPGSLENYVQEGGRAGRDQQPARCILLYDPQDIETQFGLCERARLHHRDIQQVLKKLRSDKGRCKGDQLIVTAGEILLDNNVDTTFAADDRDAETKIITAIAWLERGDFLRREENRTRIFPACLAITLEEALKRLRTANLSERCMGEYQAILRYLYQAGPDERINTDELMALTKQTQEEVIGTLKQMEQLGLLSNDSQLTLYVRHGVVGSSQQRLQQTLRLEEAVFELLTEWAPDADQGEWQDLNLPQMTTALRIAEELTDILPVHLLRLLRSLAQDRDGESQQRSSFELRQVSRDHLKLRIKNSYTWQKVGGLGEKRRAIARQMVNFLISKLAGTVRGKDLLVETSFGELVSVIEQDLDLRHRIAPEQRQKAVEHVLLYLHQQQIITLNHGMTVMRRAMTIQINTEKKSGFLKADYQRLEDHYGEKRMQVHVMREYAEMGLVNMAPALEFLLNYFSDKKKAFLQRYFADRGEILELATSENSWRNITSGLNEAQQPIVSDNSDTNRLVLAGPGSGKTRVIVHRIAYLLRVRRIPASSIIALTFNRHAANEIRQRLFALVGSDAIGLTVLTYHSMAMRLTGTQFGRSEAVTSAVLNKVMADAVELLEGSRQIDGEDDLREQLLRGYRYILVDEYQDIDQLQYRLVSALAGRQTNEEGRLCILAVGDDDQNIYGWRETSNQYIERFREEYEADIAYLVENYRSTRHIIRAANCIIEQNPARLKAAHPVHVDQTRQEQPDGGIWETLDPKRKGQVLRLSIPECVANDRKVSNRIHGNLQAQTALDELQRLLSLEDNSSWDGCAVLARTHQYLQPVQAWCEQHKVPYFLGGDKQGALPLTRDRGFVWGVEHLRKGKSMLSAREAWQALKPHVRDIEWQNFFQTAFMQLEGELGNCQLMCSTVLDWLYEYARELRRQPSKGLYLGTVHSAKGLEFRHVVLLDGGWQQSVKQNDERQLYYVGMTRAEQTLTLCEFAPFNPFAHHLEKSVLRWTCDHCHDDALDRIYKQVGLADVDIGYAGRHLAGHSIHAAISELQSDDALQLVYEHDRYFLRDQKGRTVGRMARSFRLDQQIDSCKVAGIVVRYDNDTEEAYQRLIKCKQWEVVIPRICCREVSSIEIVSQAQVYDKQDQSTG